MSTASRIRHSFIGKAERTAIHLLYRARHPGHDPVTYRLPGGLDLRLYPEGEIAEFLAFPWLFEKTEVALVTAFLKPGMQIIDVGANIGLYSILARKVVGDSRSVWAFEPSGDTVARLERNLALNTCDGVRVFQLGLADAVDTALRLASDAGYGDAYRYLRPTQTPSPPMVLAGTRSSPSPRLIAGPTRIESTTLTSSRWISREASTGCSSARGGSSWPIQE